MCALLSPNRPFTWVVIDERETETCQRPSRHPPNGCKDTNCGVSGRAGPYCGESPGTRWQLNRSPTRTRDGRIWCAQELGTVAAHRSGARTRNGTHEQTAV